MRRKVKIQEGREAGDEETRESMWSRGDERNRRGERRGGVIALALALAIANV